MINKSLARKLIIVFSAVLISVIALNVVINAMLLSKVYRTRKVDAMERLYESLANEYKSDPDNDRVITIVKNTLSNENLRVFIWDKDNRLVIDSLPLSYDSDGEFADRDNQNTDSKNQRNDKFFDDKRRDFRFNRMEMYLFFKDISEFEALKETAEYTVFLFDLPESYDEETLCLRSTLPGEYKLLIQMPYAPIDEAVSITTALLLMVGLIMLILGIVIVAITSKTIAKPVKELSQIASSMEKLDFSKKYVGKGRDEIASLGESINALSEKLEVTINELKQKNDRLLSDIELKSKIDTMRKEFIANASHELKTPLALISGYAEGLRDNIADSDESREMYADVIIEEAARMDKIIRQMLDLMELDGADEPIEVTSFALSDAVKSVLDSFELVFKQGSVKVSCSLENESFVSGDFMRIRQAISNYLSNAVNHVDDNKVIIVKVSDENNDVVFSVFNSGGNISDTDRENIWERYYKVDKAHTREYGGSGLGLSIVKSIVELHGGRYGYINKPDGVEFYFSLPKEKEFINED